MARRHERVPGVGPASGRSRRPTRPTRVRPGARGLRGLAVAMRPALVAATVLTTATACAPGGVVLHGDDPPRRLAEWGLLHTEEGRLVPATRALVYDLSTPLFSDYAHKLRTVWMPEGATATKNDADELSFPVGTVFTKTFFFPVPADDGPTSERVRQVNERELELVDGGLPLDGVRLLETRLLVHEKDGWRAHAYVWNDEQTQAALAIAGDLLPLTLVREDGSEDGFTYVVPDNNQCAGCHATNHGDREIRPIGPKPRHLDRDFAYSGGVRNQLEAWHEVGFVPAMDSATAPRPPAATEPETAGLDRRARAYLDVNCGHCHSPTGPADTSGLFLDTPTTEGRRLGICKPPVAAGRGSGDRLVSIHPGRPDLSIMTFRMDSVDPGIAMPELGRGLVHREGVELIARWIASLEGDCEDRVEESGGVALRNS